MDIVLKNSLNFYEDFKEWYEKIVMEFEFDSNKDRHARDYLSSILAKKSKDWSLEYILNSFAETIQSKSMVLIYGCGPSLEESVQFLLDNKLNRLFDKSINLAADGASVLLKQKKVPLDAIFSDLDGISKKQFYYANFVFVHAHGDNMDKLKLFEKDILKLENVIGTTQVEPVYNVINPGGFTDGDRIIFFLKSLLKPYHTLFLIGMDFNDLIGKYSKPDMNHNSEANPIKRKKLEIAVQLLSWIFKQIKNKIYFVNCQFVSEEFKYLSLEEFKQLTII